MKWMSFIAMALMGFSVHAEQDFDGFSGPGELAQAFYSDTKIGIQDCGRVFVSGRDKRLSPEIRARNVDEVIVIERADKTLHPGVLVDWDIRNDKLQLEYSRLNGSLILQVERDFKFNDLSLATPTKGVLMRTNSFISTGGVFTNYWILSQHVSEVQFRTYFHQKVVPEFIRYLCN